ncbi:hypothetical protein WJ30_21730 [Burkholderia diffusa]|nr:hypothetical protein WJ30_21730 [Burkholderia diffusa]
MIVAFIRAIRMSGRGRGAGAQVLQYLPDCLGIEARLLDPHAAGRVDSRFAGVPDAAFERLERVTEFAVTTRDIDVFSVDDSQHATAYGAKPAHAV